MGQRPQQGTVSMSFYGQLYPLDQRAQTCTLMGANQVVFMEVRVKEKTPTEQVQGRMLTDT